MLVLDVIRKRRINSGILLIYLSVKIFILGKGGEKGAEDSGVREVVGKERKSGVNRWDKMG